MPKRYSAVQIIKALQKLGFVKISQKGSHIKMRGIISGKLQTVVIPNHKAIAAGTLSSILRQAGLKKEEFEKAVK
jgi:predicted RNA binding protein YcfA (HicA-like mRNA interferase family)